MTINLDEIDIPELIRAPRTDRIYNCHAYLTKVRVKAILPFVEQFTRPGEVVLDPFAGSGMTGLAAAMQGRRATPPRCARRFGGTSVWTTCTWATCSSHFGTPGTRWTARPAC